jgi:hypothetical protein
MWLLPRLKSASLSVFDICHQGFYVNLLVGIPLSNFVLDSNDWVLKLHSPRSGTSNWVERFGCEICASKQVDILISSPEFMRTCGNHEGHLDTAG